MHRALKIGPFWAHIPGYETRADCPRCGVRESLAHILTECQAPGQDLVWAMTGSLWYRKTKTWSKPTLEDILAVGLGTYAKPTTAKRRESIRRLWRIVISEAAYLIWKLRCERVIEHTDEGDWEHSRIEISRRWHMALNRRLQMDLIATRKSFGLLAHSHLLVLATWSGVIGDEQGLQLDWTRVPRFLQRWARPIRWQS
ncbi:uncharacterized protein C8Q71DRAFT_799604 [Rhodofomes roseus]|uniref:Reverse transcriptase zinc-binding domain-containing protein n=1 Tax=Rhodofomes roseus TaxID=34475 RepID=A0ABQ8K0V4_9APHY|nr:uncharacterized protein C8Q71DRAFT_799604 [Rhodofomes roseus]KAH9829848.1 hypothetical protein C8Q71DRAFT_799604 [Rhodofomes roseus]